MVSNWIKADRFENTECWYEDCWIRLLLFLLVWRMENRKEFRWTNRSCIESEYGDQFQIVICTYSYHQTDIWKSREQWYLTTSYFGIETNPLSKPEVSGERIKEEDVIWVKKLCSECMTRYGTGHVTEVISPQSVWIDGVPRHIKDLRPVTRLQPPVSNESKSESETNEPSLWFTPAPSGSDSNISSLPGNAVFLDSQTVDKSTSEDEAQVVSPPPRRSLSALSVIMRSGGSVAELTEATLKVNTGINFKLSFAPTLTTKLIFENPGSSDILRQ